MAFQILDSAVNILERKKQYNKRSWEHILKYADIQAIQNGPLKVFIHCHALSVIELLNLLCSADHKIYYGGLPYTIQGLRQNWSPSEIYWYYLSEKIQGINYIINEVLYIQEKLNLCVTDLISMSVELKILPRKPSFF